MKKGAANQIILLLICMSTFVFTGCGNNTQESLPKEETPIKEETPTKENLSLEKKKVEISRKIRVENSSINVMSNILQNDWPKLFLQKNEEELFKAYSAMTWHVTTKEKEKLKSDLSKHKDYLSYADLYKKKTLPAEGVRVKEMKISEITSKEKGETGYELKVIYRLQLKNGKEQDISFKTNVFSNFEYFNPLFNVDGAESFTLPPTRSDKEELQREYFYNITSWKIRELTPEELLELLKF